MSLTGVKFAGLALQTRQKQPTATQSTLATNSRTAVTQSSVSDVATFSRNQPRFGALTTIKVHPRLVPTQKVLLDALNNIVRDGNYQVELRNNFYHIHMPEEHTEALYAALRK